MNRGRICQFAFQGLFVLTMSHQSLHEVGVQCLVHLAIGKNAHHSNNKNINILLLLFIFYFFCLYFKTTTPVMAIVIIINTANFDHSLILANKASISSYNSFFEYYLFYHRFFKKMHLYFKMFASILWYMVFLESCRNLRENMAS